MIAGGQITRLNSQRGGTAVQRSDSRHCDLPDHEAAPIFVSALLPLRGTPSLLRIVCRGNPAV